MNLLYCCNSGARSAIGMGRPTSATLMGRATCDKLRGFIHSQDVTRDTFMSYVDIVAERSFYVNALAASASIKGIDITPNTSPIVPPREGVINGTDIHE